jgi:predicted polyphosphate/ATP-dependent NAD kinase
MRLLVCGGREFNDVNVLQTSLDQVHNRTPVKLLIEGGALGADLLAREWATWNAIPVMTYKADWSKGRKAGPMRNSRMLEEGKPDLVVAFLGGNGTFDMIRQAKHAGVPVICPHWSGL